MSKQSKLETVKQMLDDKAFKDIFSSQSIEHFKEMIDMVAKEQYERGFQDGGNLCNQTFSRICDTLARN
tara:strand:- start:73 stop:279 length:207 start_codon:yes stop_codon:yes gene_type:complete